MKGRIIGSILSFILAVWLLWLPPARAQGFDPEAAAIEAIPTILAEIEGEGVVELPDWTRITIRSLPAFLEAGNVQLPPAVGQALGYDPSRTWEAGAAVADVLLTGDWGREEIFGLAQFSVRALGDTLGIGRDTVENIPLSEYGVIGLQTAASLVTAIPGLEDLPVDDIAPIAAFASEIGFLGGGRGISETSTTVGQLASSAFGNSPIGEYVELADYALGQIPGVAQTPLESFAGWAEVALSEVPYLQDIPFSAFPRAFELLPRAGAILGRTDVVWGAAEHGDALTPQGYFLSGGTNGHLTVPVACAPGAQCPYVEVTAFGLLGEAAGLGLLEDGVGQRWVSGRAQEVDGGHGVLGNVNNGKEPTGRLVFGDPFKVVHLEGDESEGRATFGLYFRVCVSTFFADLGCTPYFIGPIPWLPTQETELLLLGGLDAPHVNPPQQYPQEIEEAIAQHTPSTAAPAPPGALTTTEPGAPVPEDCLEAIVQVAPANLRESARQFAPLIAEVSRREGLSDAQLAYVFATAQHESNWGLNMEEIGRGAGRPYGSWYGRGFVQLTWEYNYIYWSNRLGVDLVGNPSLATDPQIAAEILVVGSKEGTFTGVSPEGTFNPPGRFRLDRFINSSGNDFINARRIINGTDRAQLIAGYAEAYLQALQGCRSGPISYRHPFPNSTIAGTFGRHCNPVRGLCSQNAGIDWLAPERRPVVAAAAGWVRQQGRNWVELEHENGDVTRYVGLAPVRAALGQRAARGQVLGRSRHLHFELVHDGQLQDPGALILEAAA